MKKNTASSNKKVRLNSYFVFEHAIVSLIKNIKSMKNYTYESTFLFHKTVFLTSQNYGQTLDKTPRTPCIILYNTNEARHDVSVTTREI